MSTSSEIVFTENISSSLTQFLSKHSYSKLIVLVDENTAQHCLPLISPAIAQAKVITIASGEEHKHLGTCEHIWKVMTEEQLDRKGLMINLGGGVIGDMGGFCASTYKRGIDFIQIPTTLLSQVDASVGGKLGIDFMGFKNHIGVFQVPQAVLIHSGFLNTLSPAELRSGFAEIIKHCLIADPIKWKELIATPFAEQDWLELGKHSVVIKAKVTEEDPLEKGLRKILNFGHTIGHAVESYFLAIPHKKLLHGEAIAIGMIAEAYISFKRNFISEQALNEISNYIFSIYGIVELFDFDLEKILPLTLQDKKNEDNIILCTLLEQVGKANFNNAITLKEVREALNFYSTQAKAQPKQLV